MHTLFDNRLDAAIQLAALLEEYKGFDGVVLAIPRGGVPVGAVIAQSLGFPLDIALSKKIGHPLHPEYAIGAVSLTGSTVNPGNSDVPVSYIEAQIKKIQESLKQRYLLFKGDEQPLELKNKTVIVTDDGIATGSTILSTIKMVRAQKPATIVVAVPVAPIDAEQKLREVADKVIILSVPVHFMGVGQFYRDFSEVSDEEVIRLMRGARMS